MTPVQVLVERVSGAIVKVLNEAWNEFLSFTRSVEWKRWRERSLGIARVLFFQIFSGVYIYIYLFICVLLFFSFLVYGSNFLIRETPVVFLRSRV